MGLLLAIAFTHCSQVLNSGASTGIKMITQKSCTKCRNYRPVSEFSKEAKRKDGLHPHCRSCVKEYEAKRWASEKFRESRREYQSERFSTSESYRKSKRNQRMKKRYGITISEYEERMALQEGKCAICNESPKRSLHVDHCHISGNFRGLLCGSCNRAIGLMQDDPERLQSAIEYLGCVHHEPK